MTDQSCNTGIDVKLMGQIHQIDKLPRIELLSTTFIVKFITDPIKFYYHKFTSTNTVAHVWLRHNQKINPKIQSY